MPRSMGKKVTKKDNTPPPTVVASAASDAVDVSSTVKQATSKLSPNLSNEKRNFRIAFTTLTLLAFFIRFFRINKPDEVVFDEVHFGKFASHYLQREYYFDLHPPLAKMMFALVGYLIGYDGSFKFDKIGDSYITNSVPYVAYRMLPATLSSLTISFIFLTLEGLGFSVISCVVGTCIVLFDSAQVTQSRLILLDATLMFFMVSALLCYVRFRLQRHNAFGLRWWMWLILTGVSLSSVISTKYVGLFTYVTVGVAVIADLWNLTDIRGKSFTSVDEKTKKVIPGDALPLKLVFKHFIARFNALVLLPFVLYLFWFYVHFRVLTNSGPGNAHMSPEFQATLGENPMVKEALDVHFFDFVSLKSSGVDVYLHSHIERYPMQYDDGRISSQGQQVTGYHIRDDPNSLWQILPPVPFKPEEELIGAPIVGPQQVMLRHVGTNTYLMTHDVASPGYPTNEEFTTVRRDDAYGKDHNNTLFILDIQGTTEDLIRTKMTQFRLKHVATSVAMWRSDKSLPDWGFNQIEINGNKNLMAPGTVWTFDHIENVRNNTDLEKKRHTISTGNTLPRRSFFTDYWELQTRMFRANNQLTATHPYMSTPDSWPLMRRGISFWSSKKDGPEQKQIYLVGNHIGWYTINFAVVAFVVLVLVDQITQLRGVSIVPSYARHKLNTSILWLFLGYMFHYLPFFLMGRQLFLHHYLPAQIMGSMLVGALLDFSTGMCDTHNGRYAMTIHIKIIAFVFMTALVYLFIFWSPLVYGLNLSGDGVRSRQWFEIDLQFNKSEK